MENLDIIYEVCNKELKGLGTDRKQHHVFRRMIYYKIAKDNTTESLRAIGEKVDKNHATVLHALESFQYDITDNWEQLYLKVLKKCKMAIKYGEDHISLKRMEKTEVDLEKYLITCQIDILEDRLMELRKQLANHHEQNNNKLQSKGRGSIEQGRSLSSAW